MTAATIFEQLFRRAPTGSLFTPARVNLIGEHLDYNGGLVLPMSLPIGLHVAVGSNDSAIHRIQSTQYSELVERPLDAAPNGHWSDYCVGALRQAQELGFVTGGMDVALDNTVPPGSGLSTSAALIVGLLKATAMQSGGEINSIQAALQAQMVENDYLSVPVGIMDQMAVSIAAPGEAVALDTKTLEFEVVSVPADWRFAVVHSGVRRKLTDGRYGERRRECEAAAKALGASDLCLLTDDQRSAIDQLAPILARRARHADSEHRRTKNAVDALKRGDRRRFGELLVEGHTSIRDDFEITTEDTDRIAERAVQVGAYGARQTGGGFGGCLVALVDEPASWFAKLAELESAVELLA